MPFAPIISWTADRKDLSVAFWDYNLLNQVLLKYVVSFLTLYFSLYKVCGVFVGGQSSCYVHKDHLTSLLAGKDFLLHARVYIWLQLLWSCGTVFWGKNQRTDYILYFYKLMGRQHIFLYSFFFFFSGEMTCKIKSLFTHL